jgi:addiction module HigA family antidote
MLAEEFLKPLGMTQAELAKKLGLGVQTVNMLINGKRSVTAETAIMLSRVFRTTPQVWMNLQAAWDLWHAQKRLEAHDRRA